MRFVYIIFYLCFSLLCYDYTNTNISPERFVAPLTLGARSSGNIGQNNFSQYMTRSQINEGGKGF